MVSRPKKSKTPSPSSAPPPEPVFFVDRDLGKQFPEILRSRGLRVEIHDDHYPAAEKPADNVWLTLVAQRGWIAVSHDANIRYTSRSREAIIQHKARLIIVKGHARSVDLAENFVLTVGAIRRFIGNHSAPWIAKLYRHPDDPSRPGRIERWA